LNSRFIDRATDDGLNGRINFRGGAIWGSSLLVFLLLEGPPMAPALLIEDDFESNVDEQKEVSDVPNETRPPLCDASIGCPTAAS
jgi:hypothetical protein